MNDVFGNRIYKDDVVVFAKTVGKGGVELACGTVLDVADKSTKVIVTHEPESRAGDSFYMGNHPEAGKTYRVTVPHRIMVLDS